MLTSISTRRNRKSQGAGLDPCQPPMPSQHTSGSYGSFHNPRVPGPGSSLLGATHVDLPGGVSPNTRKAGRFAAFLIIAALAVFALRAYQQNEINEELGKERIRWQRELAAERERWEEELETEREERKEELASERETCKEELATERGWWKEKLATERVRREEELATERERRREELATERETCRERLATERVRREEELAMERERCGEELATERERCGEELAMGREKCKEELATEAERRKEELATERERCKEELQRALERWERALGRHVPQGAFWDDVWPAVDCRAYDTREYWGTLQNIPEGWTDLEACMNMPVEINGVGIRRPYRCAYVEDSPHVRGYWKVGWNQPDCRPWLQDFHDTVRGRTMNGTF